MFSCESRFFLLFSTGTKKQYLFGRGCRDVELVEQVVDWGIEGAEGVGAERH